MLTKRDWQRWFKNPQHIAFDKLISQLKRIFFIINFYSFFFFSRFSSKLLLLISLISEAINIMWAPVLQNTWWGPLNSLSKWTIEQGPTLIVIGYGVWHPSKCIRLFDRLCHSLDGENLWVMDQVRPMMIWDSVTIYRAVGHLDRRAGGEGIYPVSHPHLGPKMVP